MSDITFIDWGEFWQRDRAEADWVYPNVLARGRGHALFASQKVGKSLLMLWVAVKVATSTEPVVVVYLDWEMGEDDLHERLEGMGYGPGTDLTRLRYALLPSLPALDSPEGATAMNELLCATEAAYPGHHVVVLLDTMGRAVHGPEDSADTIRSFYKWTGTVLREHRVTWARLDHAGKDPSRGQRGSSAKGDDVDVVWQLTRADAGLELRRQVARMNWVPERVAFAFDDHHGLVEVEQAWPAGTAETAATLDVLDVPLDATRRTAEKVLRQHGHGARSQVVMAALKFRREAGNHGAEPLSAPSRNRQPEPETEPPADQGEPTTGTTGNQTASHREPSGPPLGGPMVPGRSGEVA